MLFLSRDEVETFLDPAQLIDALASAMVELSAGRVSQPPRIAARVDGVGGLLAAMPVHFPAAGVLSAKLVGVFPGNAELGAPTHQALIAAFDPRTGAPLAVMDGACITERRTAAGSALATRLLAPPDADRLVILGAGAQARAHAALLPLVRPPREVWIWSRRPERAAVLAREVEGSVNAPVRVEPSLEAATRAAGILCACTGAAEPVVRGRWLSPGAHVNSVGFHPEGREVDGRAIGRARVFVESRDAALAPPPVGSNDLLWALRDGEAGPDPAPAELGELVAGSATGRQGPEEITLYKSVGVGAQDAAAVGLVLREARERGAGLEVEW